MPVRAATNKISKTKLLLPPLSQPKKKSMGGIIQITIMIFLGGLVTLGPDPDYPSPPPLSRL